MRNAKYEFTMTGFVIALIVVTMFAVTFSLLLSDIKTEYSLPGTNIFDKYNYTDDIITQTQEIRNATNINQQTGILDILGGFFSAGWSALKTTFQSFSIFENIMEGAAQDIPYFAFFKQYILAIVIIAIFVGVAIAALIKIK